MDRDERSIDVKEEVHIIHDEVKFEEKFEVFEQFIDGNGVYGREEYIIKNEEINSNSLVIEGDANKEKYVDKHIQYDHTSSSIDDEKRRTKLGVADIFEQFIDEERVHDREEYIIKNEGSNSNSLVTEGDANHSSVSLTEEIPRVLDPASDESLPLNIKNHKCASFKGEEPQVLDSLLNNSETVHLEGNECNNSCPSSEKHDLGTRIQCGSSSKDRNKKKVKSIHSNIKNHKCDLCDYFTSKKWDLQKHVNCVHLNIRRHKCHLCEFASYEKQKLDVHIKCVHLKIKENKCHLCDYDTSSKVTLQNHIESVHLRIQKIKDHKCNLCEFAASKKSIIDNHVKSVHLKIKDNRCHLCEYVACRKDTLQNHIDFVHLNIKKYQCDLCEYAASVKKCLVRHVKSTHLKIKEHKCDT
ncbi:zinc finger protein 711-like isoform X6 [Coccinella septempunctata]|uniref:zinc finger protein 711-like isoform X5 n=1 Tax=Coccinella septempunctata TaxID=41139 RepID=UPI001D06FA4C|nr:zinc finger protein 711-like isoform X5 [Coccinella septempunctata]XP_044747508.1 zinc finger protein 711-like isoform X6 [Coccinella septempunctata]